MPVTPVIAPFADGAQDNVKRINNFSLSTLILKKPLVIHAMRLLIDRMAMLYPIAQHVKPIMMIKRNPALPVSLPASRGRILDIIQKPVKKPPIIAA